jgi:hypothetical protein
MEEADLALDDPRSELLKDAAARAECDRLRAANGMPLTYGAHRSLAKHGVQRGVQNCLGVEDCQFVSKHPFDHRFPGARLSTAFTSASSLLILSVTYGSGSIQRR